MTDRRFNTMMGCLLVGGIVALVLLTGTKNTPAPLPAPIVSQPADPNHSLGTFMGIVGTAADWNAELYAYRPREGRECYMLIKSSGVAIWCGSSMECER